MHERWRRGTIGLALSALLPLPPPSDAEWARELDARLVERPFELGERGGAVSLLDDGALDLRFEWSDAGGGFDVVLLQAGVIVPAESDARELDAARRALRSLSPARQRELALIASSPTEAPPLARGRWPLREPTLLRTTRPGTAGDGALALLLPPAGPAKPAVVRAFVLPLAAVVAPLPRRAEGWYEQEAGRHAGVIELFAAADPPQPWRSTFDVVRLDRDHVEWSGLLPRDVECDASGQLRPIAGGGARLESDSIVVAHALGFERRLRFERVARPSLEPPFAFRFEERKADALWPGKASGHDVVILDELGEPVAAAWLFARTGRAPPDGAAPSLFTAQSDLDGKARLPLARGVDPESVELVAFEAGARARFGRRRGATVAGGGECAVLLDHDQPDDRCEIAVEPPPGFPTWIGLRFVDGSAAEAAFLVKLSPEGRAALPALGAPWEVELELGPPYVRKVERIGLAAAARIGPAPGARIGIVGRLAAGLERRVRPTLDGSEAAIAGLAASDVDPPGAVVVEAKSLLVPAELAGVAVRFTVAARGLAPKAVVLAADAPRDQDLPMVRR